jgi:hypothetical protein
VGLNCDYSYVAATAEIATQVYDAASKLITVTGTALPTSGVTVHFGGASCVTGTESLTATEISCTLTNQPRAGAHKAEVRDASGLLPYASAVADITITLSVTSTSPSLANALGGDTLTVNGAGFPIDIKNVIVTLASGGVETDCKVLTTSESVITCFVEKMSSEDGV